jgi:hypothetical protein
MLERGGSPPKVVTEPDLRFSDMHHSLKEWPPTGFTGEQVAEAGLGRDEVCSEASFTSGETEFTPEGRSALLSYYMFCQGLSGCVHTCNHSGESFDKTVVPLSLYACSLMWGRYAH